MSGFDGTGPVGVGPMTGRSGGYCVLPVRNDAAKFPVYGPQANCFSLRPRFGRGLRRGGGGRGRRFWW